MHCACINEKDVIVEQNAKYITKEAEGIIRAYVNKNINIFFSF